MAAASYPVSGFPLSVSDAYLPKIQLCRDAVPTLPISAAGTWSRLPMAERLIPERPMPRWPSPVTYKKMPEAYFPVSGLPLIERMRCHRIPTHCIPCQLANFSTGQLTVHRSGQLALWSTDQLCVVGPSISHHSPCINQLLPFELR
jgi:hypothetical protein